MRDREIGDHKGQNWFC